MSYKGVDTSCVMAPVVYAMRGRGSLGDRNHSVRDILRVHGVGWGVCRTLLMSFFYSASTDDFPISDEAWRIYRQHLRDALMAEGYREMAEEDLRIVLGRDPY